MKIIKTLPLILILLLGSCVSAIPIPYDVNKEELEKWCQPSDTNEFVLCEDLPSGEKKKRFEKERTQKFGSLKKFGGLKWCQRSDTNEYVLCEELPSGERIDEYKIYKWCQRSDTNEYVLCRNLPKSTYSFVPPWP